MPSVRRIGAALALALATFTIGPSEARAQSCRWDGTAPLCDGSCNGDETEVTRLDSIPSHWTPPEVQVVPPFGSGCFTGTKALCCKMRGVSCRWDGTAPFCDGGCKAGETRGQPPPGSSSGSACWSGSKAYCCHSTNPPATSVGQRLETNPKLTRYAAFWEKVPDRPRVADRSRAGSVITQEPRVSASSPAAGIGAGRRGPAAQVGTGVRELEEPVRLPPGARASAVVVDKGPLLAGIAAGASSPAPAAGPPAWQAHHGLTAQQFQQTFDALGRQGFRLVDVVGYAVGDADAYAGIWEKSPGPPFVARHGLTAAQYQLEFQRWTSQGYRPVHVSGYTVGNQDRYAAIWEKRPGPEWVARHRLTGAELQQEFQARAQQGYRLVDVSGYTLGGQDRYAAIWEKRDGPAWEAHHGITSAQYQQLFNTLAQRGFRLTRISAWPSGDGVHFAVIWEKAGFGPWVARHRMLADDYQEEFEKYAKAGFRLRGVAGYYVE